ncbi:MAG: hypothetical protein AAF585_05490 [Verrucomicrobiota bacterium]
MKTLRLTFVSAAIAVAPFSVQAELNLAEFEKLHAELQPDATETWRQIPWKISVLEAQRSAAAEGKPIFIWAMDGHPLGCV